MKYYLDFMKGEYLINLSLTFHSNVFRNGEDRSYDFSALSCFLWMVLQFKCDNFHSFVLAHSLACFFVCISSIFCKMKEYNWVYAWIIFLFPQCLENILFSLLLENFLVGFDFKSSKVKVLLAKLSVLLPLLT